MVVVAAVTAALGVVQTWIATSVGQQVMHRLRTDVFTHLQRQSIAFFTRTRTGEVQSRITNDIGGMQTVVTSTATSVASNLTTAIATAVAMAVLSWQLSLVSLVVLPPAVHLTLAGSRGCAATITAQQQRELADLNVTIEEGLSINGVQLSPGRWAPAPRSSSVSPAPRSGSSTWSCAAQLAGRWRMAATGVIFAAIPAVIYLGAGLPAPTADVDRHADRVHRAAGGPVPAAASGCSTSASRWSARSRCSSASSSTSTCPVEVDDPADPVDVDPARMAGHVRIEDVTFAYAGSRHRGARRGLPRRPGRQHTGPGR